MMAKDKASPQRELKLMFNEMESARKEIRQSKLWERMNKQFLEWLSSYGYDNFKQTLGFWYFAFSYKSNSPVYSGLKRNLPIAKRIIVWSRILKKHQLLSLPRSLSYNLTTGLLWEYDKQRYPSVCKELEEPLDGNPPRLYDNKKLISQDLANSIIEYESIMQQIKFAPKTMMELGGGYGRTAFVFLKLHKKIRYIFCDIPPTLWVAQTYLSSVFKQRKIFKFRHFDDYKKVKGELESSDIIFLTPNQLEMLPDKSADLFINISSLHEMRRDQIAYYFNQINRLTKGFFYFKEWKVSNNSDDNLVIRENEYPIPKKWKKLYHREALYPSLFFEAMYKINQKP